jgi:hypothetical protein
MKGSTYGLSVNLKDQVTKGRGVFLISRRKAKELPTQRIAGR